MNAGADALRAGTFKGMALVDVSAFIDRSQCLFQSAEAAQMAARSVNWAVAQVTLKSATKVVQSRISQSVITPMLSTMTEASFEDPETATKLCKDLGDAVKSTLPEELFNASDHAVKAFGIGFTTAVKYMEDSIDKVDNVYSIMAHLANFCNTPAGKNSKADLDAKLALLSAFKDLVLAEKAFPADFAEATTVTQEMRDSLANLNNLKLKLEERAFTANAIDVVTTVFQRVGTKVQINSLKLVEALKDVVDKKLTEEFALVSDPAVPFNQVLGGKTDGTIWTDSLGKRKKVPFDELYALLDATFEQIPAEQFVVALGAFEAAKADYEKTVEMYGVAVEKTYTDKLGTALQLGYTTKAEVVIMRVMYKNRSLTAQLRGKVQREKEAAESRGVYLLMHAAIRGHTQRAIEMKTVE